MNLVKVVNVSGSIMHISSVQAVLKPGHSFIIPDTDFYRNSELLGAANAGLLKLDKDEDAENEAHENEDSAVAEVEADTVDDSKIVFCDADMNAEPVSDSSFVREGGKAVEICPQTAEKLDSEPEKETAEKEYVDGIEVIDPTVDKTVKVNGVELVIDDADEPEYDPAFVDPNL